MRRKNLSLALHNINSTLSRNAFLIFVSTHSKWATATNDDWTLHAIDWRVFYFRHHFLCSVQLQSNEDSLSVTAFAILKCVTIFSSINRCLSMSTFFVVILVSIQRQWQRQSSLVLSMHSITYQNKIAIFAFASRAFQCVSFCVHVTRFGQALMWHSNVLKRQKFPIAN